MGTNASRKPRILSVGGGKGGVGKSLVATNLAVAIARLGQRVVLVDADLGAANLHAFFGIYVPRTTVQSFFTDRLPRLDDALLDCGIPRLKLLAGSSGLASADVGHSQRQRLLVALRGLDADYVIIDVGAGTSVGVLDLFDVAAQRLVVLVPQVTSVQNAYAFIKGALHRALRLVVRTPAQLDLLEQQEASEGEHVPQLLARIRRHDASYAAALERAVANFGLRLVANQIGVAREITAIHAIARIVNEFLGVTAEVSATLPTSGALHESVAHPRPLMATQPHSPWCLALSQLAQRLIDEDISEYEEQRTPAFQAALTPPPLPDPLPPQTLSRFMRQYPRFLVSWSARLHHDGATYHVTIACIGLGGALLVGARAMRVGARGLLTFNDLDGAPALPIEVRHRNQSDAGVMFLIDATTCAPLAAALRSLAENE